VSGIVERREKIQLVRQILDKCDNKCIRSVSLAAPNSRIGSRNYELAIGPAPDCTFRESLIVLLREKGLEMEEKDNVITIHRQNHREYVIHV
jgi:hypothetical protein